MAPAPSGSSAWSPTAAVLPVLAISSAFGYAFHTLSSADRYTPRNNGIIAFLTSIYYLRSNALSPDEQLNSLLAHAVLFWLLHLLNIITLRQNDGLPANLTPHRRAYKTIFNPRGINTTWAVVSPPEPQPPPPPKHQFPPPPKHQPPLPPKPPRHKPPKSKSKPPPPVPSPRTAFLFAQSLLILTRYLALSFFHRLSSALTLNSPPSSQLRSSLSLASRTHLTLNFLLHNYLLLSALHELLSILFVCLLRLDEPEEWPPLFGGVSEGGTLRAFWGRFWHRLGYASMKGVAGRAAGYWFGGERSAVRRWVEVGLVFGISGVLQVVMDWKRGWCNPWGSGWFYFVQPVGFVLEDVAMGIWAMGLREKVAVRVGKGRELRRFEQVVGYLWVWGWFWWLYPRRTILEIECLRRRT